MLSESLYANDKVRSALFLDERSLTIESANYFDSQLAVERLQSEFGLKTMESLGDFSKAELAAAGAILAYVEKTQIEERPIIQRLHKEETASAVLIDPATRANLELIRTMSGEKKGSLLWAIDKTVSAAGSRLLAERLMRPLTDTKEIAKRQDSVQFVIENCRDWNRLAGTSKASPRSGACHFPFIAKSRWAARFVCSKRLSCRSEYTFQRPYFS